MMTGAELGKLLKDTANEWLEDDVPERGAALSYYVLLSMGPLLVLLVAGLEFFFTADQVRLGVIDALRYNVGPNAADTAQIVLDRVTVPDLLAPESIITVLLLLFGATGVFSNVRGSLNAIWGVEPKMVSKRAALVDIMRGRWRGFVMIVLAGVLLAVSFLVTSLVGLATKALSRETTPAVVLAHAIDIGVSIVLTGFLFAAIYYTLPSRRIRFRTVWVGAFTTAVLFVLGKWLVTWLIASASWTSYYGPGASVVAFLAWIYFSSQLFFLGAEFTQVWGRKHIPPATD